MKTNSIFKITSLGSNVLLQVAGNNSSGSKKKEHIWHKKWVKSVGTYGEMYGYVECLFCRDPDHWGYVIGYIDENGHGQVDFDGDGYADNGYCECDDCVGYGGRGGDIYGNNGYDTYGDYGGYVAYAYDDSEDNDGGHGDGDEYGYQYCCGDGYNGGNILSNVDLTNKDNFVPWYDGANCNELSKEIQRKYRCGEGSSNAVYQLKIEQGEGFTRQLVDYGDPDKVAHNYQNAIDAINSHLDAGKVIMIGVDSGLNRGYNEGATDHFINITHREYNSETGCYEYIFTEPGTSDISFGINDANRLVYDPDGENGPSFTGKTSYDSDIIYDVTQVRPNDGNYDGTIVQPARQ